MGRVHGRLLCGVLVLAFCGFTLTACNSKPRGSAPYRGIPAIRPGASPTPPRLMSLATGDHTLLLVEPVNLLFHFPQSRSEVVADTGMDADVKAAVYVTGKLDARTGQLSDLTTARIAYIKGGKFYTVDTLPGHLHIPLQASNIADACEVSGQNLSPLTGDALDGWALVTQPQTMNGTCAANAPTTKAMVKLSTPASSPAVTAPGLQDALALYDSSTGVIVGFLDQISNVDGSSTLEHRDADFAHPTVMATTASASSLFVDESSTTQVYAVFEPGGGAAYQLFRYDVITGRLVGPLYTFVHAPTGSSQADPANGTDFYFADGNEIWRTPLAATGSSATKLEGVPTGTGGAVPQNRGERMHPHGTRSGEQYNVRCAATPF